MNFSVINGAKYVSSSYTFFFKIRMDEIIGKLILGMLLPKVLPNTTEPLGVTILKSRGFFSYAYWYWIGVVALLGFVLLLNVCFAMALTYLSRAYLHLLSV